MKVALIGNMNNNANNIAHYLLDLGIECDVLFFANEAGHFCPESDNVVPVRYNAKQLKWGGYASYFTTPAAAIRADLAEYDFLIGSRLAPAYVAKSGRVLDIFMPTGGDLHTVPVWNGWMPRDLVKYFGFARIQRQAIGKVRALYWDDTNDELEATIASYTAGLPRMVHGIPTVYHPEYEGPMLEVRQGRSEWLGRFRAARKGADFFFVSHVKHVWTPEGIAHYGRYHEKGNDQIVRALAAYYQANPSKQIRIAFFKYGIDHTATRTLARDLGVDDYITWFPRLPRREIMIGIEVADAVIGELARSWFSYGTIYEAMVMRRAVLHNRDAAMYPGRDLYPMVHVTDASSLVAAFNDIAASHIDLTELGQQAHDWLVKSSVMPAIQDIVNRIDIKRARLRDQP
jgi:hypothetical protein